MGTHAAWFLVVLASSLAVVAACRLAAHAEAVKRTERTERTERPEGTERTEGTEPDGPGWRPRLAVLGGCLLTLLALALAWRVRWIAEIDGHVVSSLTGDRNPSLNKIFQVVTCVGDVVPSFLLASLLAIAYYQQTGRIRGLVLELLVLVQLLIQVVMTDLFDDITLTDLDPSIPLGGSGTIPSGSVSRLLSLLLVAATLWHGQSRRSERVLLSLAPLLVMIEIVSRLYLGRHLLADIMGGLLLGVILTVALRWLLGRLAPVDVEPGDVVIR